MLVRKLKSLLRPLAVRLGLRPPQATETAAGTETVRNPKLTAHLPPQVAELAQRYSEKNITLFLLDRRMIERQDLAITRAIHSFFRSTDSYRDVDLGSIRSHVAHFREVFLASPIRRNDGGANFPSGVNLFLMARCLDPTVIVESGVYKGQSSYLLRAACPAAVLHAFDPNLQQLSYRAPGVTYHPYDWMTAEVECAPTDRGLCFFDDHVSQAQRVVQAHQRGFKHVVVDDSWPIESVTGCGWPPLPSIDMVMRDVLASDETVRWVEAGKMWTYVHNKEMRDLCYRARSLIKAAYEVPSLYRECGISPTSAYKYLELI